MFVKLPPQESVKLTVKGELSAVRLVNGWEYNP